MRFVDSAALDAALSFPALIDALRRAFAGGVTAPTRHHHFIPRPDGEATSLLMPAWTSGDGASGAGAMLGVKIVNVFPGNGARGLPSVNGLYVLMNGETGVPILALDGTQLTLWRTAAASALASGFLSRPDGATHAMLGAGALAPFLIRAHACVRPITRVLLWARRREQAERLAATLRAEGRDVSVVDHPDDAVAEADIISTATLSTEPLVRGAVVKPGAHLDLVGAFRPTMRESDDKCVRMARLFCDTRAGALKEGGDLADPLRRGVITERKIEGDLFDLCGGQVFTRKPEDITLFKSVGSAIEDLAAAMLAAEEIGG